MSELPKMRCDTCGSEENIAGVASSSFGAISWCYCVTCANKPAEPMCMFEYLYDHVSPSGNGEGLVEGVNDYYTYKDGKYISFKEYCQLRSEIAHKEPS